MVLRLIRNVFESDGVLGILLNEDGVQLATTLEHSYNGRPKLPPGAYRCERGIHSLHSNPTPFETFEILNVPNCTGILFHVGNWNDDSNGCVLLGRLSISSEKGSMIVGSRKTFERFLTELSDVSDFQLLVEDGGLA